MDAIAQEIAVTLSEPLLDHLRCESERLGVPLEYLVAGLVLDTIEFVADNAHERPLDHAA